MSPAINDGKYKNFDLNITVKNWLFVV